MLHGLARLALAGLVAIGPGTVGAASVDEPRVLDRTLAEWLEAFDHDPALRASAEPGLVFSRFGAPAVEPLASRAREGTLWDRTRALEGLMWLGRVAPERALGPLREALDVADGSPLPRHAAQAVIVMGERALPLASQVAGLARTWDGLDRVVALRALGSLGPRAGDEARAALEDALSADDEMVVVAAAYAIGRAGAGDRSWAPRLEERLAAAPEDGSRWQATRALRFALARVRSVEPEWGPMRVVDGEPMDTWCAKRLDDAPMTALPVTLDPDLAAGSGFHSFWPNAQLTPLGYASFFAPDVVARDGGHDLRFGWTSTAFRCEGTGDGYAMRAAGTHRARFFLRIEPGVGDAPPTAQIAGWAAIGDRGAWRRIPSFEGEVRIRPARDGEPAYAWIDARADVSAADARRVWVVAFTALETNVAVR